MGLVRSGDDFGRRARRIMFVRIDRETRICKRTKRFGRTVDGDQGQPTCRSIGRLVTPDDGALDNGALDHRDLDERKADGDVVAFGVLILPLAAALVVLLVGSEAVEEIAVVIAANSDFFVDKRIFGKVCARRARSPANELEGARFR